MSIKKSLEMKINDSIGKSALKQVQLKFVKELNCSADSLVDFPAT
jgi:hypothetical protein